jgi:hypothetical protein
MALCGRHLTQLVSFSLNYPIVSHSLLPDLVSFSAVSPQTVILLLICASVINFSYHNFSLDPVQCDVTVSTFCSNSLLQLWFLFFLAGITTSDDAFVTWMLSQRKTSPKNSPAHHQLTLCQNAFKPVLLAWFMCCSNSLPLSPYYRDCSCSTLTRVAAKIMVLSSASYFLK